MQETEYLERIRRIRFRALIILVFVGVPWKEFVFADEPRVPRALNALISEGIDFTLKQEYDRADSVIRIATNDYPEDPLGYLYLAAVMEARSMDYLDPLNFARYDSLLAIARTHAERIISTFPDSPLGYYYRGTAIGYDAYAQVDAGNWLGGILKGLSASSDFKEAVELDSTFYDAYVGVGTYYYWKSRKAEFLNWALGDRRAEGIRLLRVAAEKGDQNKFAALSALSAIYIDAHQYELSMETARLALERYPENRIFLWELGEAQDKSGNTVGALQTYERLLVNILNAKIANPYNEMLCRMNLVKAKLALKQTEGLNVHLEAILSYEHYVFPKILEERARGKFEQARNIRAQLVVLEK
jgi:tetratricopeptide (TPR) repeat protein